MNKIKFMPGNEEYPFIHEHIERNLYTDKNIILHLILSYF
jgi:hypothetical protein